MWGLLERCLNHPSLSDIKAWLDKETPNYRDELIEVKPLKPDHAMILAAGLGTRMKPLTDTLPKPLIKVAGKEMLAHSLDALAWAGVKNAVINKHHHADQVETFVKNRKDWRPKVTFSDETSVLLDSGGGVKKALPLLGSDPFYILNSDMILTNKGQPALGRLATAWNDDMDILMLLINRREAIGHDGVGDFHLNENGSLRWRGDDPTSDYHYGGVLIIRPECFEGAPDGAFTLRDIFRKASNKGRLYGLPHEGVWYHVGTHEALKVTEQHLKGE
ncbi:MAG: nucleotidyltransferase family protein [Kordiimonadaceae bacterium]|nr:nucleotidyltransferase family protein [Kordiimonadaceae bacterium]